jgi:hypothetical protein
MHGTKTNGGIKLDWARAAHCEGGGVERHVLEKPERIGDEDAERNSERSRLLRADMVVERRRRRSTAAGGTRTEARTETLARRRDRYVVQGRLVF